MQIQSAPFAVTRSSSRAGPALPERRVDAPAAILDVATVGYLVPRADFVGCVHSVYAQACNIAVGDTLLTLCLSRAGDGPTVLRLVDGSTPELRALFDVGERITCRHGIGRTGRIAFRLTGATVWRPTEPGPLLAPAQIDSHLRAADRHLAQRRRARSSVIDGHAAPAVAALRNACRTLDRDEATRQVDRLIGWGEGLTPAGDDFLVGLMAGLDALVLGDERRHSFRAALAAALVSRPQRTTPIAAHYLRLAAGGHYNEPLTALRNVLLAEPRWGVVEAVLRRALDVGATSGADTVSGLLAGLSAWCPGAAIETGA